MSATKKNRQVATRVLTNDEKLVALHAAWETSSGITRERYLLAALKLCSSVQPLPEWVFAELCKQQSSRLPPFDRETTRWLAVRMAKRDGVSWKAARKVASQRLKGTFAGGAAGTIWHAYKKVQRVSGGGWRDQRALAKTILRGWGRK